MTKPTAEEMEHIGLLKPGMWHTSGIGVFVEKGGLEGMAAQHIVQTSKRLAAERQIHAAIAHFNAGDFECAITLCSAAEGQMPEPSEPEHLFRMLQDHVRENPAPDG